MDNFFHSYKAFNLSISLNKTVVMFQPTPGSLYIKPTIFVDGHKLKLVDKFTYVGSVISRHCTLDDKMSACVKKATDAFCKRLSLD